MLKKFGLCTIFLLAAEVGFAAPTQPPPLNSAVFNITNTGAVCDGITNDDAAINRTLAAAAASSAYQNNNKISIIGPAHGTQKGCVINSLNLTVFNKGTGANTRPQVEISNMTLLCTGHGNTCADLTQATFIRMHDVSIRGDNVAPPEICIQLSTNSATSSAWHILDRVNCNNEFTFTALYNMGSEANSYVDSVFENGHSSSGVIGTLGSITGGSSYTNGTYTNVALTGGTGNGALATIVVSGAVVSTVTITYEGRDYVSGDTLSAAPTDIGGTGSGFSVPVSTISTYACVLDGQDHWRSASAFVSYTGINPDTWQTLTLVKLDGVHCRQLGTGKSALWAAWTGGLKLVNNSYLINQSGSQSCLELYDSGVIKSGILGPFWGDTYEFNCEGNTSSAILLSGTLASRSLHDVRIKASTLSSANFFKSASNVTAVNAQNLDLEMFFANTTFPIFDVAKAWTVIGRITLPSAAYWNAPTSFQGPLLLGTVSAPPSIGPLDILPGAAWASSCARLLSRSYIGALCQAQRASDSLTLDIYPNAAGDLDSNTFTTFCNGTTCAWKIRYDQSGNGNNWTQTTAASQPAAILQQSGLGNRVAATFVDGGAQAMTMTAASTINDLFATGGYITVVANDTASAASAADHILDKWNGGSPGTGWDFRLNSGGTSFLFQESAVTTNGTWSTPGSLGTGGRIYDTVYSAASVANVPTVGFNGTSQTLTSTQPVGAIGSDAAINLLLGNNAATAGTRGFPGYIAEDIGWKVTPTATQQESIRRNQAQYYNISSVN